ncbi:MAG: ribosome biogenesis GTPase Der [Puniceicoccales bacterium]|jgi:GTP-binding protein|nr:ribosome biogenesis GTPase Der [Puniceicoccales bacterium]
MRRKFCLAIVGRPNVGKSRLFNRLTNSRRAIVHDQPGITRDVMAEDLPDGTVVLDTGGLGLVVGQSQTSAEIAMAVEEQVHFAIAMADLILLVLDARSGVLPMDDEIAGMLRRIGKPVIPVANKVDNDSMADCTGEFTKFGFARAPIAISAEHNRGIDVLQTAIGEIREKVIPSDAEANDESARDETDLSIAFVGAPNVGKSSLTNLLVGTSRVIVSETAGTTRDSISAKFEAVGPDGDTKNIRLVDTAGLRSFGKMDSSVEYFSSVRAREAMGRVDVIFLVLDAVNGITRQVQRIVHEVEALGRPLAVIVNKWDLSYLAFSGGNLPAYESVDAFRKSYEAKLHKELFAWVNVPILFTSALTDKNRGQIVATAFQVAERAQKKLTTGMLNRILGECVSSFHSMHGKPFKLFYALQTATYPHTMRIYCNQRRLLNKTYESRLRRQCIESFDLGGCPLRFEFFSKPPRK